MATQYKIRKHINAALIYSTSSVYTIIQKDKWNCHTCVRKSIIFQILGPSKSDK